MLNSGQGVYLFYEVQTALAASCAYIRNSSRVVNSSISGANGTRLGYAKKASAMANIDVEVLPENGGKAIMAACDTVI